MYHTFLLITTILKFTQPTDLSFSALNEIINVLILKKYLFETRKNNKDLHKYFVDYNNASHLTAENAQIFQSVTQITLDQFFLYSNNLNLITKIFNITISSSSSSFTNETNYETQIKN